MEIRKTLRRCIARIHWPETSKKFVIYPESGKKSDMGNGVKPIKAGLMTQLKSHGWQLELKVKSGHLVGNFDAAFQASFGLCIVEWETGNISSSHRSLNKMSMLLSSGAIATGTLVVPSRELYKYLTDRVGNSQELEPYLNFWKSVPCQAGVLEIIAVEHDSTSLKVPRIPMGTDGRALV